MGFPKRPGHAMGNYPDVTDDFERLKLQLYDQLVAQRRPVAPVVINRLFAPKGPFDVRHLAQFPNVGEYARLHDDVVEANTINQRLYGLAFQAAGHNELPEIQPQHIPQIVENTHPSRPGIVPELPYPRGIEEMPKLPDNHPVMHSNTVLKGGVVKMSGLPPWLQILWEGGSVIGMEALKLYLANRQNSASQPSDIIRVENNQPNPSPVSPRLPLTKALPTTQMPSYTQAVDMALSDWQAKLAQRHVTVPKPQTLRASWDNPIQAPPVYMAENRMQNLATPDMSLPQTQQPHTDDPRLARLQHWQRLQAAQEQINSITRPRESNIMGGRLRPSAQDVDIKAMMRQSNDDELRRLQLEQARLERRPGKHIQYGYVNNLPPKRIISEEEMRWEGVNGTPGITAEVYFEILSWVYGAGEAVELILLLRSLKIPLNVFMMWLKDQFRRSPKDLLKELAKRKQIGGFWTGKGGAQGTVKAVVQGIEVNFPADQVKQKVMKHASDLGWPRAFKDKDMNEILEHLVQKISQADIVKVGTWKKRPCVHFYDSNTGVVYIIKEDGKVFETFFKLAPRQLEWLMKTGDLS